MEDPDLKLALPLEILENFSRLAIAYRDDTGWRRILEIIIRRTQSPNEYWASYVLNTGRLQPGERSMLVHDLYADLCERLIRALIDTKRLFWEENFQHCLQFERQHVYQAFMTREGRWNTQREAGALTHRIPRKRIMSLEQPLLHTNGELWELDIEDERTQQAWLSVEQSNLARLILGFPGKLKCVSCRILW